MDGVQIDDDVEPVRESVIRRRRKWSVQEKAQIVGEALRSGAVLQEVAQRHGLHPSLLTRWRTQHQAVVKKVSRREAQTTRSTRSTNSYLGMSPTNSISLNKSQRRWPPDALHE